MKKSIAQLKRGGRMLEQVLDAVAGIMYDSERPMFDAIRGYWKRGLRAESPIERVALDNCREECRRRVRPQNFDVRREIISRVALLLLEDVYPETQKEVTTNDQD